MTLAFSINDIASFTLLRPGTKKKELLEIPVSRISLEEYRLTLDTLIIDQAMRYAEGPCDWNIFDPSVNNMFFPPVTSGICFHYPGFGKLYTYDIKTLKSTLQANRCSSEKEVKAALKKRDFSAETTIDDFQVLRIQYRNGTILDINKITQEILWNEESRTLTRLRDGCTQSGLLAAVENYAANKELDQDYAMNLIHILEVAPEELNLENRGAYLDDVLGL